MLVDSVSLTSCARLANRGRVVSAVISDHILLSSQSGEGLGSPTADVALPLGREGEGGEGE